MKEIKNPSGARHSTRAKRNPSAVLRAAVEALEGRTLLSSVVVNSASDTAMGAGVVTLRDAISIANGSTTPTTITFSTSVFAKAQTITLDGTDLDVSGTEPVTITGPAAGVTIDGNQLSGDLVIEKGAALSVSGMTITGPNISTGDGGEGVNNNGTAALTDCNVSGNSGGGIYCTVGATMTLTDCTVSGNVSTGGVSNNGTVTLTDCTVSGNSGGGVNNNGTATFTDCTVSGNSDGGIFNVGTATLTDSTVSDNTCTGAGGGIFSLGTATLADCTVSGNTSTGAGGGIYNAAPATSFALANSIVAGNTGQTGPDASGRFNSLGINLVGATDGSSGWSFDDLTGTAAHPLDAKLGPPANNGGPTQTLLPLTGSPAIDHGDNALVPKGTAADQRGLPRISNGTVDIGAVEVQETTPIEVTAPAAQSAQTGHGKLFSLGSFTQSKATGPFTVHVHWGDGTADSTFSVHAAGTIPAAAHTFTFSGSTTAIVSVTDSAGHASNSATFVINITGESTVVVNSASDTASGPGVVTLRDAVNVANRSAGPTTITFAESVFKTAQTITLDGSSLELSGTEPVTVTGPAAGLTIDGNQLSGDLLIDKGAVLSMFGMTITGADTTQQNGGDGIVDSGTATLTDCTVTDNAGGGINCASGATMALTHCTVSDNTTTTNEGGFHNYGVASLTGCTVSDNTVGVTNEGNATMTLTDCTVSGNAGSGIVTIGTVNLSDCTISENSQGGISNGGILTLTGCTVSENTAGGVHTYGNGIGVTACTIADSIVAGNTASAPSAVESDVTGQFNSLGFNLIGATDGSSGWGFDDLTGTAAHPLDPKLGPLADNGGPTQTLLPLAGSPAIDHGNNTLVPKGTATDQRGLPRISNGTVDIGAVEVQATVTTPITVTAPNAQSAKTGKSKLFAPGSFTRSKATGPFIVDVHWGDETADTTFSVPAAGTIPEVAHTFSFSANITAVVSVTDSAGHTSNRATFDISVTGASAVAVNSVSNGASGPGVVTLGDAINIADRSAGPTTITFDPTVFATPRTIILNENESGADIDLSNASEPTTLIGPTAGVTIDNNGYEAGDFLIDKGVTVNLSGVTITGGNTDGFQGAGIDNNGTATLTDCTISGNTDFGGGGGIYNDGTATLVDCTISGNTGGNGGGGGIKNAATLSLTNCTLADNSTYEFGGGIDNGIAAGTATLTGCVVSGNTASNAGGGIDNGAYGAFSDAPAAAFVIANTIVAGNMAPAAPDADGAFDSLGFNLVGQTDDSTGWVKTDLTGTTAKPLNADLGPLANNGGPTLTLLPLPGSPAIGHGSVSLVPKGITTDQRGFARVVNGMLDIGAVELRTTSAITGTVFYDANGDGAQDDGEAGLAGVQVYDDLNDLGYFVTGDPTTLTNATGGYALSEVSAGKDIIRQVRPLGYAQTSPANGAARLVTVAAGQTVSGQNFGDRSAATPPAAITGAIFNDGNGDGTQDDGETGLSGLQVYLDLGNVGYFVTGDPSTTTNVAGLYTFSGLAAGNYIVRQALPLGYVQTTPSRGLGDHVIVSAGQTLSGQNFGDMG